jgi:hypothetical protein
MKRRVLLLLALPLLLGVLATTAATTAPAGAHRADPVRVIPRDRYGFHAVCRRNSCLTWQAGKGTTSTLRFYLNIQSEGGWWYITRACPAGHSCNVTRKWPFTTGFFNERWRGAPVVYIRAAALHSVGAQWCGTRTDLKVCLENITSKAYWVMLRTRGRSGLTRFISVRGTDRIHKLDQAVKETYMLCPLGEFDQAGVCPNGHIATFMNLPPVPAAG